MTTESMITITIDDVFTKGDAFVMPGDRLGWTFVAANKRGREAVQRIVDDQHPDKAPIHIEWRDAGEGWPDTWLGFDFQTSTDKPFAASIRAQGVSVFHQDADGAFTYLPAPGPAGSVMTTESMADLEARRLAVRSKIEALITSKERVDLVIDHWEETAEMEEPPREPQTSLETLLREHHEICEQILDLRDEELERIDPGGEGPLPT